MEKLTKKERYLYNKYKSCRRMALAFYVGMCVNGALLIYALMVIYLK